MRIASLGLALLLVAGCPFIAIPPHGGIACTGIFVYGLSVTVTDVNDNPITGATLTLTEGDFTETMEEFGDGTYGGAGERAGTYTLTVEADGFVTQVLPDIVIDADECHVIPVVWDVVLVAG